MAQATQAPPRRSRTSVVPSVVTLAFWRLRQTWRLLLVTGAGFIAAVVIICSVPLLSNVALTASLRDLLTSSSDASQLAVTAQPSLISTQAIAADKQEIDAFLRAQMGTYLARQTIFTLVTNSTIATPPIGAGSRLQLTGADFPLVTPHLQLLQGRFPTSSSDQLEMLITDTMAFAMGLHVGSTISTSWTSLLAQDAYGATTDLDFTATLPMQVVGIIAPADVDYWHGTNFQPDHSGYYAIMDNATFLKVMTAVAAQHGGVGIGSLNPNFSPVSIAWYFPLQASAISITNLDDLIASLNQVQTQIDSQVSGLSVTGTQITGPMFETNNQPSSLERFRSRSVVLKIPVFILAAQVLALILFFVSIMANLLIERQALVIALLRSRGASHRQVFGSFVVQTLGLGLAALVLGPLLALLLVALIGHATLAAGDQNALNIITDAPFQAALGVGWVTLPVVIVSMLALLLSIWSAAQRDVLAIRRESARTTRRPLWQRLQLDVVAAVMALAAYGASVYVSQSGVLDASAYQVIALPLSLVGPPFLIIAGMLVFLRLFQRLLRLLARRAARRASAPPMLALAQMSRAPQPALRVALLLALAAAFAIFSLVFTASEQQQIQNVAAQQAGADFSGDLPAYLTITPTVDQWEQSYRQIAGVIAASAGYQTSTTPAGNTRLLPLTLEAVDTHNFAQVATWGTQDATQPLSALLAQIEHAQIAQGVNAVPALVDAVAWTALHLAPGAGFNISLPGVQTGVPLIAIAEVQHIPTVNDSLQTSGSAAYVTPGGIIVDYQRLAAVTTQLTRNPRIIAANYIWLHTSDDPTALKRVRLALTEGDLQLLALNDRRALIDQMEHDPLSVAISGILLLGAITALLLALVGAVVASWLNARSRLTNFALLRALGSAPRQIASVFAWEQGMVYAIASLLGVLFGGLLVLTGVPGLVFANPIPPGSNISDAEFYVIQHVLPVQIVWPASLGIAVLAFCAICALVLGLMTRIVSRPSIGQTLRLNED
jgi:ABC-type antimicrobial peptide transport system permease subunit